MRRPVVVALLAGMTLEACSAEADGGRPPVVRDSAGIGIVETGAGAVPTAWSAEEVVSIGSMDGSSETTFNRIGDLAVGPDGRIYVLDAGDHVVKAYDRGGTFLFQVGGEGDGPSEFRGASLIVVGDDGFAVFDYRAPKLARFGWDGEFEGSARTEFSVFEYGFPEEWVDVPGGAAVVLGTGCSMPPPEDRRPRWKLLTLG
ncbi:MAG TPA: 6-bladed beta-propeller, partial [Longimicrobiales bacterium]|nr:6-bladed beta-propeller [Longimicrobiales bacterium]